jgi:large subunit ribosomal protein L21
MKYAIVKNGSNQLKIHEGDKVRVMGFTDKADFEVLFFSDGKDVILDGEKLKEVNIISEPVKQGRERKLVVGRYKSKSRYDKQRGFRAQYSEFIISGIEMGKAPAKAEVKSEAKTEEKEKAEKKTTRTAKPATEKKTTRTSKKLTKETK